MNYGVKYTNLLKGIQDSVKTIQGSYNESGLAERAMDNLVGLFTDDTVEATYKSSLENTKKTALASLATLDSQIKGKAFSPEEGKAIQTARDEIAKIAGVKLESVGIVTMTVNSAKAAPETANLALHATKGMIE